MKAMVGMWSTKAHSSGYKSGFTLIELSIVLVIIGLIVGGILTGQELIRSATLKSVITDEQKYVTAVNTFRTKYNALPGDMPNATSLWGTDPGGCPNPMPYTTAQTTTCNGNGDGFIENEGGNGTDPNLPEKYRSWQQLANAGLIQGAFTGNWGPNFNDVPGLNEPTTKIPNGGFEWVAFIAPYSTSPWAYFPQASLSTQYLAVGTPSTTFSSLQGPLFSPADAQAIDMKMDDGLPRSGNILASVTFDGGCVSTLSSNSYNTATKAPWCSLLFAVKSW